MPPVRPVRIELLWFDGCPNHEAAEALLRNVLAAAGSEAAVERIQVEDPATARAVCFPGSPTIRINGLDVEPGWEPCEECTPRCRVYATPLGLRPLPPRSWIEAALRAALS
jgi:hypothetical protein